MFVNSIEKVSKYTRPIYTIVRGFDNNKIIPGAASLFFINELGCAITCKHVAYELFAIEEINKKYKNYKKEVELLKKDRRYNKKLKSIRKKYGYTKKTPLQAKFMFVGCVDKYTDLKIQFHNKYDLAIIQFNGFGKILYENYAVFVRDSSKIKQGRTLCRLGYPFPEFNNYKYNPDVDDIDFTPMTRLTPSFPIDGMVTRMVADESSTISGIELSTPGLKGQSGCPLFDENGIVYGVQSLTHSAHLGFDFEGIVYDGLIKKKISNSPFIHLGRCVHVNVIKDFLKEKSIKFYEEEK